VHCWRAIHQLRGKDVFIFTLVRRRRAAGPRELRDGTPSPLVRRPPHVGGRLFATTRVHVSARARGRRCRSLISGKRANSSRPHQRVHLQPPFARRVNPRNTGPRLDERSAGEKQHTPANVQRGLVLTLRNCPHGLAISLARIPISPIASNIREPSEEEYRRGFFRNMARPERFELPSPKFVVFESFSPNLLALIEHLADPFPTFPRDKATSGVET
jgi:hypothetical protein